MCLATPARVVKIEGLTALVDFGGVRKEVLVTLKEIFPGDLVMVHAGTIIGKIDENSLLENLKIYQRLLIQVLMTTGLDEVSAEKQAREEINKMLALLGANVRLEE